MQGQAATGDDIPGEVGAGGNVAEKSAQCLGLYSQQKVGNF